MRGFGVAMRVWGGEPGKGKGESGAGSALWRICSGGFLGVWMKGKLWGGEFDKSKRKNGLKIVRMRGRVRW